MTLFRFSTTPLLLALLLASSTNATNNYWNKLPHASSKNTPRTSHRFFGVAAASSVLLPRGGHDDKYFVASQTPHSLVAKNEPNSNLSSDVARGGSTKTTQHAQQQQEKETTPTVSITTTTTVSDQQQAQVSSVFTKTPISSSHKDVASNETTATTKVETEVEAPHRRKFQWKKHKQIAKKLKVRVCECVFVCALDSV
jgi:hypothetical protein